MLLSPRASQSLGTCVQRQVRVSRAVLCMLLCAHTQFVKPAFSYWLCYMTHTVWDKSSSQFLFGMMNSVTKNVKVIFIFSIFMFLLIIQERNLINTQSSHLCEKSVHLGNFLHSYQVEAVLPIPNVSESSSSREAPGFKCCSPATQPWISDIASQGLAVVCTNPAISASHTRGFGEGPWFFLKVQYESI